MIMRMAMMMMMMMMMTVVILEAVLQCLAAAVGFDVIDQGVPWLMWKEVVRILMESPDFL